MGLASSDGTVCSVTQVKDEIVSGPLIEQIGSFGEGFFRELNDGASWARLMTHVIEQTRYTERAILDFRHGADSSLIAYAMQEGLTLVTGEIRDPLSRSRVTIPDICEAFNIPVINLPDMIEAAGARFTLDPAVRESLSAAA